MTIKDVPRDGGGNYIPTQVAFRGWRIGSVTNAEAYWTAVAAPIIQDVTPASDPLQFVVSPGANNLYRFRFEPSLNGVSYALEVIGAQYYALETWEPRHNFYIWGATGQVPIVQYFFVPTTQTGEILARLETEKGVERAQMDIYTETGTEPIATLKTWGTYADQFGGKAYLDSQIVDFHDPGQLPEPGGVFRFELTIPVPDGSPPANEQPSGNTWVRFGRPIPPYFANHPDRLIYPVVHRDFDPVGYTTKTMDCWAYLCAPRQILPAGAFLKVRVGLSSVSTDSGYRVYRQHTSSGPQKLDDPNPASGNLYAVLLDGSTPIALSTDKVDTLYVVREPVYGTWPAPLRLIYDHHNGAQAEVLHSAGFDTVQTNVIGTLEPIADEGMTALGVLYGEPSPAPPTSMLYHFLNGGADDPKVLLWANLDEPDSGPGDPDPYDPDAEAGRVATLKYVYDLYYDRKQVPTDKPISLNIMHGFCLEEYSKGCDVIMTDPYVKQSSEPIQRIEEWRAECRRIASGQSASKKVAVVLWLWRPDLGPSSATEPSLYKREYNLLARTLPEQGVDVIASWTFAQGTAQLDLQVPALWEAVCEANGSAPFISNYPAGWSLVSLPMDALVTDLKDVFPDAISAFISDGGYQPVSHLASGVGYWVNFANGGQMVVCGQGVLQNVVSAAAGLESHPVSESGGAAVADRSGPAEQHHLDLQVPGILPADHDALPYLGLLGERDEFGHVDHPCMRIGQNGSV